jgi:uncharacterized damage-inducible protein DinB
MQTGQASFLLDLLIREVEEENRVTRRVLQAIPEERREYRPHPDGRSALELAWHIASSEIWCLAGIIHGQVSSAQERMPSLIKTVADVIAWRENNVPGLIEDVKRLPPEQLARPLGVFDVSTRPAVTYLLAMIVHTAHHRGQLSAYLRAMGAKVPPVCGASADEPFPSLAR